MYSCKNCAAAFGLREEVISSEFGKDILGGNYPIFNFSCQQEGNKTVSDINERLVTIEATLLIQKGQIEILLGLISSSIGKEELIQYLKFVIESPGFGDSAKISAKEMILHQDNLWSDGALSGRKQ